MISLFYTSTAHSLYTSPDFYYLGIVIFSISGIWLSRTNVALKENCREFFVSANFCHVTYLIVRNSYWDWTKYAHNIYDNLLFDGGVGSMSGDGAYDPDNKGADLPSGRLPIGKGGGCIKSGPFKGRMMNLGPYSFSILGGQPPVLPSDAFLHRPRCLQRDLNPTLARINHNETTVHNLIYESQTMQSFHVALSGGEKIGIIQNNPHAGGHFLYGGAGLDFFASNGDPVFYLHHAQVDRVWAKWQALDPENRQYALDGTHTIFNNPPSLPVTVHDSLNMGIEDGGNTKVGDAMTKNGPLYCYRYDDE